MDDLSDWLINELNTRGWSQRELSRRSGISATQISDVIKQASNPGADFCLAIARAMGTSPEAVMRRAGILPRLPPDVEEAHEASRIIRELAPRDRDAAMAMLRGLAGHRTGDISTAAGHGVSQAAEFHPSRSTVVREGERSVYDDDIPAQRRLLASILVSILDHLPHDDVTMVYDAMRDYRDRRDEGVAGIVPEQQS